MKKNNRLGISIIFLFLIILFTYLVYKPLIYGFFQQDEWIGFGNIFVLADRKFWDVFLHFFAFNLGHYVPLHHIVFSLLFRLFGLNYLWWFITSIFWHILIVYLVFLLSSKLFKSMFWGFVVAFLFGLFSAGYQATAWVGADVNTHGATLFGVLSVVFFLKFIRQEKDNVSRYFWFSILSLVVSLLFKEITIALFVLLLAALYIFGTKSKTNKHKYTFLLTGVGALYILARLLMFIAPSFSEPTPIVTDTQKPKTIFYNLLSYPIKTVSQTIIPSGQLMFVSRIITTLLPETFRGVKNTTEFDKFVEKYTLNVVDGFIFTVVVITIFIFLRKKEKETVKIALFGFLWVIANSFIYVLSPARSDAISIIDSRNLYFPSIGTAILLVSIAYGFFKDNFWKTGLFLLPFFAINVFWLNREIKIVATQGATRKEILQQIKTDYPDLPDKVVFYTETDTSFYGLPPGERIFPFQSGLGQTLLVWFQKTEQFPKEFFQDRFLWEIESQGYKETGGRGFGYFRDFDLLEQTFVKNEISPESIIAFCYDSESKLLEDITEEVQGRIRGFESSKRLLSFNNLSLETSENPNEAYLAIDGNQNTKWDSKLEYIYPQFLVIDLGKLRNVAQVRLDSFDNKDQNAVGYRVLLSDDGKEWKQVFHSKRYPPDSNGLIDLYFEPQPVRFIKIEQIGKHRFASWVIHELEVYEVVK